MDERKINEWAKLLLDLGKRNNLINFRETKNRSVDLVAPDIGTIFKKSQLECSFEVYDPNIRFDELNENKENGAINRAEYIKTYSTKIKSNNQVLLYNRTSPLYALKEIRKVAFASVEETGVNIAHLAFGFVQWKESKDSNQVYKAPLLLIPITIPDTSKIEPFKIITLGEDVVLNPILSFKLENEYGFSLPEYQEQELDDYINKVNRLVAPLGWNVLRECKIGLFSFLKINMYYDLRNNVSKIKTNSIIQSLLGTNDINLLYSDRNNESKNLENPVLELHNVVDADSSQMEAIEMAKTGKSFVLQGPPGTGKSQTITNIIAECLNDGKKVLFVSEKQAALNVVFEKLKQAGLEDFCLELHSYKANKKDFISNINDSLNSNRKKITNNAVAEIKKKKLLLEKLDSYEEELHKIRPIINQSLFTMYDNFFACRKIIDETSYIIDDIENKGIEFLEKAEKLINDYADFTNLVGYNYQENPWFGYIDRNISYRKKEELNSKLIEFQNVLENINKTMNSIVNDYGLKCESIDDLYTWNEFFNVASTSNFVTPSFLKNTGFEYAYEKIDYLENKSGEIKTEGVTIFDRYDDTVIEIDSGEYENLLDNKYKSFFSRIFSREYRKIVKELKLQNKNGEKESYNNARLLMKKINVYKKLVNEFEQKESLIKNDFGSSYDGIDTNWQQLKLDFNCLKNIYDQGENFGYLQDFSNDKYEDNKKYFTKYDFELKQYLEKYVELCLYLTQKFDNSIFDIKKSELQDLIIKINGCVATINNLENWIHFIDLLNDLENMKIKDFIDAAIKSNVSPQDMSVSFKKTFYHQWIENIIMNTPVLSQFNYIQHNRDVEEFKEQDIRHFTINKALIRSKLYGERPPTDFIPPNSPIAIIKHEANKKRKQKSIRNLLAETGELIQVLKPCFLMSPLSVSTYLNNELIHFDTIVFDEASQIFPQDAIGSIYRGNQLIVVGDSKQMPPSNFFSSSIESEESEDFEEDDIKDYESILDLCSTNFSQLTLKWHYRSKFEELIQFSNKNFYKNELVTFPSSTVKQDDSGVNYYKVSGVYDRQSRTNRIEAEKVVDLVFEHFSKYPDRSLGVVAFNTTQQSLIEKLISKRRETDHSKDNFFKRDIKEAFFVKNLETVQGDERDTIIFSISYARDSTGKFIANFGPLNKVGGERRLNVAVTRAKINVKIVSSISYTDIPITNSIGSKLLREYLDFAENGEIALSRSIFVDDHDCYDSDFEVEVCEYLRSCGFVVETQVGCSSFRIDLAIRKPDTSEYVLAIECDGATYHSSKNARDRDRLRQQILESMGWKFYRIWSTDWFKSKDDAKKRLIEAVNNAFTKEIKNDNRQDNEELSIANFEVKKEPSYSFPIYKIIDLSYYYGNLKYYLNTVFNEECPINEEWLLKRSVTCFGRKKVTKVVYDEYLDIIDNYFKNMVIRKDGFIYLKDKKKYKLRVSKGDKRRNFEYISYEELAAGLLEIIKSSITITKEDLFITLVKILGFSKITPNYKKRLDIALTYINNKIKIEKDNIRLKTK